MAATSVEISNAPAGPRWLTRDSGDNGLGDVIDVWLAPPQRWSRPDGGAFWLDAGDTGLENRELQCTVEYARMKYRTIPDDDRMCVRID